MQQETASDVYNATRDISRQLLVSGQELAANEVDQIMKTFWTTSSEALGEIRLCLLKWRPRVIQANNQELLRLVDDTINAILRLFNGVSGSA